VVCPIAETALALCSLKSRPNRLQELPQPTPIADKVAALRTEAGLAAILDGIGEGFYAVDRDWRILLFNNEASRHFKCSPEHVLGRELWQAFPRTRHTGLGQLFQKVMASREAIRSETESVVFPGRWMAYRLFPLGDGIGVVFRDTTDRHSAEAQRDLLMKELEHRVKNTLAIVQSIASQTFRKSDARALAAFEARLIALSNAHGILTQRSWDSADLHELMTSTLRPQSTSDTERFAVEGPALRLGPRATVALSLAVHELCTNAIKYGALSADGGQVRISWAAKDGRFLWTWSEYGGPLVVPPERKGFGSLMIERALSAQLSGTVAIDYVRSGVVCTIDAPLEAIRDDEIG
jgi:two-component system CheB/CheR fusion protein